jgi:hypothetical protein
VWPPPGMAPVPDSLLGLGPFMFTGTGVPLTRIQHRTALPLSAPPPWPGSREGTAARAARAARAGAATVTLLHALGDEQISNALGMHRIGAADGQDWSLLEVASFAAAFERYGRDFRAVASAVNTKSVRRCVGFYYNVWKVCVCVCHSFAMRLSKIIPPLDSHLRPFALALRPCSCPRQWRTTTPWLLSARRRAAQ